MTRRIFVKRSMLALAASSVASNQSKASINIEASTAPIISTTSIVMPTTSADSVKPKPENRAATLQIEATHPRIVALSAEITRHAKDEKAAAILIHDWVRDQIMFGISKNFYEDTATEVLDAKLGYCNTKVSLFNALLRARGIATRIRMMDLSALVLKGLFDPGTAYVDHAITEVFLDGRWIKVDSYVVDKVLANSARKQLNAISLTGTPTQAGFGIHVDGRSDWDGQSDSLIQCVMNGQPDAYVLKDHGTFADVNDFYRRVNSARNRKTIGTRLQIRFGSFLVNRQIASVRGS